MCPNKFEMAATIDLTNGPTECQSWYLRYQNYGCIKPMQTRFTWEIHDFGKKVHRCRSIKSPNFTTSTDNIPANWVLTLFPNGSDQEYKDYIAVNIQCLNPGNLVTNFEISLLNGNGVKCCKFQVCAHFNSNNIKDSGWTNERFVHRSSIFAKKNFYILNDAIQICCVITTNADIQTNLMTREEKSHLEKLKELSKFENLLNDKIFTDVILKIGNEKIGVHKAILACSSSVFKAMFTHRMSERNSREVEIEDVDISTVKAMLKYIYSADFENFNSNRYNCYLNLLIAAEKYCIESLKEKCQDILIKELKLNNVLHCIVHADIYNALHLKKAAMDFAVANATAIVEGPTFEEFMKCNTAISCEVVRILVTKKRRTN